MDWESDIIRWSHDLG